MAIQKAAAVGVSPLVVDFAALRVIHHDAALNAAQGQTI